MFTLQKNFFKQQERLTKYMEKGSQKKKTIKEKGHSRWKGGKTTGSPED